MRKGILESENYPQSSILESGEERHPDKNVHYHYEDSDNGDGLDDDDGDHDDDDETATLNPRKASWKGFFIIILMTGVNAMMTMALMTTSIMM